jgi:uncharacterized protein (TIGR00297 family)
MLVADAKYSSGKYGPRNSEADGTSRMLNLIVAHAWASSPDRVLLAAVITVSFASLALGLHGVNRAGAVAGGAACLCLFVSAGPPAFATLVMLFVLTWTTTHFGARHKQELGLAERREGRNATQVMANLGVAAASSIAAAHTGDSRWLLAATAALAEAATDTVASEIGQTGGPNSRLITTWKPVASGTDGGITLSGTMAGGVAGLVVTAVAVVTGMIPIREFWIPAVAGFIGMLTDSVLGATLQRRGLINNDGVNLMSTVFAAGVVFVLVS